MTSNRTNSVVYIGVTSELVVRIQQHKDRDHPKSFTARYNIDKLVWFEHFATIEEAIACEKQLKAGGRERKNAIITALNPEWRDLYPDVLRAAETGE